MLCFDVYHTKIYNVGYYRTVSFWLYSVGLNAEMYCNTFFKTLFFRETGSSYWLE